MVKRVIPLLLIPLVVVFSLLASDVNGAAQLKYPTRPVTIIVAFAPGGSGDLAVRVFAPYLSEKWGVPVQVVNKPGGNGIPARVDVLQSAPDGYTILSEGPDEVSLLVTIYDLPFKILEGTCIANASSSPCVYSVPASSPWRTLKDVGEAIKKDPQSFVWVSGGTTSTPSFANRQFIASWGVDPAKTKEVVGRGGAETAAFLAGGHVQFGCPAPGVVLAPAQAGTIRPLAITSKERFPLLPEVPTTRELGYPQLDCQQKRGFTGPANLPLEIVEKWNQTLKSALADPKIISQLQKVGHLPLYENPAEFRNDAIKGIEEVKKLFHIK